LDGIGELRGIGSAVEDQRGVLGCPGCAAAFEGGEEVGVPERGVEEIGEIVVVAGGIDSARLVGRADDLVVEAPLEGELALDEGGGVGVADGVGRLMADGIVWRKMSELLRIPVLFG
jgi:hypothetical protein